MKINAHKTIATLALVLMTTAVTFATGAASVPHTFSAGQTALAAEVNDNFQALADAINALSAKVTGQYDGADSFTVSSVSVTNGDTVTLDGSSYIATTHSAVSYETGNSTQYSVIAPVGTSSNLAIQSNPTYFTNSYAVFQKTTINNHAALVGWAFYSTANTAVTADCRIQIKLDSATYVTLYENYAGTLSTPATKAQQTAAINHCKALLNYVSLTATPAV